MRGYPVGSFLLWEVMPETAQLYTFYEFLTNYHERDNPYADRATVPTGTGTTAVLDGQQRLTSLNIALYGSFAEKKKYAWWNSPVATASSQFCVPSGPRSRHPLTARHALYVANCVANGVILGGLPWTPAEIASP